MAAPVLTFKREPHDGGDSGAWAPYLIAQTRAGGLGALSLELYDNSGALNMREGFAGIDDGVTRGVIECTADGEIDTSAASAGTWHSVELSVSGTAVTIHFTAIAGATDESFIPSTVKAAYNASKQGYYLNSIRRLVGIVFMFSTSLVGTIVNCEHCKLGFKDMPKTIDKRMTGSTSYLYAKTIMSKISSWNMDAASSKYIPLTNGADIHDRVLSLSVMVRDDADHWTNFLGYDGKVFDISYSMGASIITLERRAGGTFDSTSFDDTSFDRGYVTVTYGM